MTELPACLSIEKPNTALEDDTQITATEAALGLLNEIQARNGPVSLHHQGGCASGADTLCLPIGEMRTGNGDDLLGVIQNAPVFVFGRGTQDWDDRQFVLGAIVGNCGGFSLDSGMGRRFFVRCQPFMAN